MGNVYIHSEDLLTVSAETGEITPLVLRDGDVVKKSEPDKPVIVNRGRSFVKVFPDVSDELCRRLSGNALFLCFAILPFIWRDSGVLKKGNGQFVTRKFLCEKLDKPERTIDRGLAELTQQGILAKSTVRGKQVLIANPYVFQNGVRANATLLALFEHSGWKFK